jgi:hypothetical protein
MSLVFAFWGEYPLSYMCAPTVRRLLVGEWGRVAYRFDKAGMRIDAQCLPI